MIGLYNLVVFPEQDVDVTDLLGQEMIDSGHAVLSEVQPVQSEEQDKAEAIAKEAKPKKEAKK